MVSMVTSLIICCMGSINIFIGCNVCVEKDRKVKLISN